MPRRELGSPRLTALIYISESEADASNVTIKVEGSLNRESLPVFQEVFAKHMEAKKWIAIDLGGIMGLDRNAKAWLKEIKRSVKFVDMPAYLKLEIGIDP